MCAGISVFWRDLTDTLIEQHALQSRVIVRHVGADREIQFLYRDPRPLIPAWVDNQLGIYEWGCRASRRSKLPKVGCISLDALEGWRWLSPQPVDIPATFGLERGIWYQIREGVKGVFVRDEGGLGHVFILTQPASHYYSVMTRSQRMPVFQGSQI